VKILLLAIQQVLLWLNALLFAENRIINYEVKLHVDRNDHTEQEDIIKTTLYEQPRGKSRYRRVQGTDEQMHSE